MNSLSNFDARHNFGRKVLGPIFLAWAQLLHKAARRDGVQHLVFLARDGEFLREVQSCWQAAAGLEEPLTLHYAWLSRRSTSLLRLLRIDRNALAEASAVRAGTPSSVSLLTFLGLDVKALPASMQQEIEATSWEHLSSYTCLPTFQEQLDLQRELRIEQVRAYLNNWGLPDRKDVAFVDIGWQGSIVRSLQQAVTAPNQRLRLYLMGHWGETFPLPETSAHIDGLLGDWRRGKRLREASVYHLGLLLEAVCREAALTVAGYTGLDPVLPKFVDDPIALEIERSNAAWRSPIRKGILDAIRTSTDITETKSPEHLRLKAQRHLFWITWFPSAEACIAASGLLHVESHASGWSIPLISHSEVQWWRKPRSWMAGLASPWRTAYIMANGGPILAALYAALEATLLTLPPSWRIRLKKSAQRKIEF